MSLANQFENYISMKIIITYLVTLKLKYTEFQSSNHNRYLCLKQSIELYITHYHLNNQWRTVTAHSEFFFFFLLTNIKISTAWTLPSRLRKMLPGTCPRWFYISRCTLACIWQALSFQLRILWRILVLILIINNINVLCRSNRTETWLYLRT